MNYIGVGGTLPVPFNLLPSIKSFNFIKVFLKKCQVILLPENDDHQNTILLQVCVKMYLQCKDYYFGLVISQSCPVTMYTWTHTVVLYLGYSAILLRTPFLVEVVAI